MSAASSRFTSSQRRCHLLLLLYLPTSSLRIERLAELNGVTVETVKQDIAEVEEEIRRYHQLDLHWPTAESIELRGAELNRRLCLLHTLRRGLRVSPDFVQQHFAPVLRQTLGEKRVDKALYDEKNLQALIMHCAHRLQRTFAPRDCLFLQIYMQFILGQATASEFNATQLQWLADKPEREAASELIGYWQKRCYPVPVETEVAFWTLLFCQLHTPALQHDSHPSQQKLQRSIDALIARFEQQAGTPFRDRTGLGTQLYCHMAQALERCHFDVGIDNTLTEEITRLYPRLLRTTAVVLQPFADEYCIRLSEEEVGLIAVIFGAWLMQENTLQEKQVLLLTDDDRLLEQEIEQQLREMTLLPLNISYQSTAAFQQQGAPKAVSLVISPYAITLPLYSPPLVHAELPISVHQQQRIRLLLES